MAPPQRLSRTNFPGVQEVWNFNSPVPKSSTTSVPTDSIMDHEIIDPVPHPRVPNDFEPSEANGNIAWCSQTIAELLDLMGDNYNFMNLTSDQNLVANKWEEMCSDLKARAFNADYTSESTYDVDACARILTVDKLKSKWNTMKDTYKLIRDACELTGVGGQHPNVNWVYYDQVGQIMKDDRCIHNDVSLESLHDDIDNDESIFRNYQAERDLDNEQQLFHAAEETQALATGTTPRAPATTTVTEEAPTPAEAEAPAPAATTTEGNRRVGRGRYSFINIAEVRRNLADANIEFENKMQDAQDNMFHRMDGLLGRQANKRKADLDNTVNAILTEREQDRQEKRRRHADQQGILTRLADSVESMAKGQKIMLQMMGYEGDHITDVQNRSLVERSSDNEDPDSEEHE